MNSCATVGSFASSPLALPSKGSQGVFEEVKQSVIRVWSSTVFGLAVAREGLSHLVFSVLGVFYPGIEREVRNLFLSVRDVWRTVQLAWREEEHQNEVTALQAQNLKLEERLRVALEKEAASQEVIAERNFSNERAEKVVESRDAVEKHNETLQKEIGDLLKRIELFQTEGNQPVALISLNEGEKDRIINQLLRSEGMLLQEKIKCAPDSSLEPLLAKFSRLIQEAKELSGTNGEGSRSKQGGALWQHLSVVVN